MHEIYDYAEAGFKIFGLYGVDNNGRCECGHPDCLAIYKHPRISNWQNVPDWSADQLETFSTLGHFKTGFGALCAGWLVIDVDARNGGVESFRLLCDDIPGASSAAFVVNTGSGNGSQHHYFKMPIAMPLSQQHHRYKGIDFKTSGYVVGAGSMHASGAQYESEHGYPQDITDAPQSLIDILKKPERHRVDYNGGAVDVSDDDVAGLLGYISPDGSYEEWVKVGMAVHHCTGGTGFALWDDWSAKGKKYPGTDQLHRHWHSFGKSASPAGYGTLMHYARAGGYVDDVTFEYIDDHEGAAVDADIIDLSTVDLLRPPGFVGDLSRWINAQCLYPRENLAVAAALQSVSALAGMRFVDELDHITPNLISFCVAGSGTGKEAVQQAYLEVMRAAGIQGAVHGGFKSEQELYRNLIRHQAAFYVVDELGLVLRKLDNAGKKGGAAYLEGIIGTVMSVFSKAKGFLPVTGDLKEEIREALMKELSRAEKRLEDLPADSGADNKRERVAHEIERVSDALQKIDSGLDSPYLNILGYTTPVTFNDLMTFEQATNGFMARAMIFTDLETNPKRKTSFRKEPMSDALVNTIRNLWAPGVFDMMAGAIDRVEYRGDKTSLPTTPEAAALMDDVYHTFYDLAEQQKGATGLEAIPRRGYEIASKVSILLGIPGGVRTAEHVRWAYAAARRDVDLKIQMAYATAHEEDDGGLGAKILTMLTKEHGELMGVICNRFRKTPKLQVEALVLKMVDSGMLVAVDSIHAGNGKKITRYFSAG